MEDPLLPGGSKYKWLHYGGAALLLIFCVVSIILTFERGVQDDYADGYLPLAIAIVILTLSTFTLLRWFQTGIFEALDGKYFRLTAILTCLQILALIVLCASTLGIIYHVADEPAPPVPPPQEYAIGGSISGLTRPNTVDLTLNGAEMLTLDDTARDFIFRTLLKTGDAYSVTASGGSCAVDAGTGTGTVGTEPVTTIAVTCR